MFFVKQKKKVVILSKNSILTQNSQILYFEFLRQNSSIVDPKMYESLIFLPFWRKKNYKQNYKKKFWPYLRVKIKIFETFCRRK